MIAIRPLDIGLIGQFIAHHRGGRVGTQLYTVGDTIATSWGSYQLATWDSRFGLIVNLERSASGDDWITDVVRPEIIRQAEVAGVPFLPVSRMAFNRVAPVQIAGSPVRRIEIIHRLGLEAVFTVGDRYYLSAYDAQEDPPLYFLCRLPRHVGHVNEARYALRPASVNAAIAAGIPVKRQGDLFAIRSQLTDDQLREAGGKIFPTEVGEVLQLYGTSHTADRVAVLPDHRMLVSGRMIHDPRLIGESRDPDHHPLILDGGWWWVARNTVPIERFVTAAPAVTVPPPPAFPYAGVALEWDGWVDRVGSMFPRASESWTLNVGSAQVSVTESQEPEAELSLAEQVMETRRTRARHYHHLAYGHRNW